MIGEAVGKGAAVYTDDSALYNRAENCEKIRHKAGEWVRGDVQRHRVLLHLGISCSCAWLRESYLPSGLPARQSGSGRRVMLIAGE